MRIEPGLQQILVWIVQVAAAEILATAGFDDPIRFQFDLLLMLSRAGWMDPPFRETDTRVMLPFIGLPHSAFQLFNWLAKRLEICRFFTRPVCPDLPAD
jgi:hypothetical protein